MADNSNSRKVMGFKRFSDIKTESKKVEELDLSSPVDPEKDSDRPMNPNLPVYSRKIEKPASRKNIIPQDQDIDLSSDDDKVYPKDEDDTEETNETKVETFGKVAKFPKNVKASKAYNFLENVKVPKKSIWYIMVEKDNELQMVKYNYKEGVDLTKFVGDLKTYYIAKNKNNKSLCEAISKMSVDGNDKYSMIRNIPLVDVDGKKLITKVTEDLIKLLSK